MSCPRHGWSVLAACLLATSLTACGGCSEDLPANGTNDDGGGGGASETGSNDGPSSSGEDATAADAAWSAGCGLVTCQSLGATCGPIGDGCGGLLSCGSCTAPQTCGGGGVHSTCGGSSGCIPRTCAQVGAECGPVADGCGGLLECGGCSGAETCGGGGRPNICGSGGGPNDGGVFSCVPRSCAEAGATCGPIGDGCGGLLDCGECTAPQTCGGGGVPSVCGGNNGCTPRTCAAVGATCGPISDGCGGLLECGSCRSPATCGGGGVPNQCGTGGPANRDGGVAVTCRPRTCLEANVQCGPTSDGCGGILDCGACTAPQTCGGGGALSMCGGNNGCVPRTCQQAGATCGPVADGCGGLLQCGNCNAPATCGGGGRLNQCGVPPGPDAGVCRPRTCAQANADCGPIGDGCGGLLQCGTCRAPNTCGGGSVPSRCGNPAQSCTPRTCAEAGASCGPVADGCGALIQCGSCAPPDSCGGGGVPSVCGRSGMGPPCTNLCLRQVSCPNGGTTSLSGTVLAPTPPQFGTPDPLYNAVVYVPNAPVAQFRDGVSCDRCGAPASGDPLVSAVTGADGRFTLLNVPTGPNIPLVIQLGRWRRHIVIPNVPACQNTALTPDQTRMPRRQAEFGDPLNNIPKIAIATGNVDTLECVLRKIGIADAEFTLPTADGGRGRVQIYVANGSDVGGNTPPESELWGSDARLAEYDMVLLSCEGRPITQQAAEKRRIVTYTSTGGRVFATHYSYVWMQNNSGYTNPFRATATWRLDQSPPPDPITGIIDQSFPRGMAFAQWLSIVGAASGPGRISINEPRHDLDAVLPPAQRWIYTASPNATIQQYTFNTPLGVPPAEQCGRVLFSDFHVDNARQAGGQTFPDECQSGPLTPQEKVLEFLLFDLASCIAPDQPTMNPCTPRTCQQANATCGPIGDGCGGMLSCGTCQAPATCGGGGVPSQCGGGMCTPRTCQQQNISCGPAGDGCGGSLNCGSCPTGQTCGGGGVPGQCGSGGVCTGMTCQQQMLSCGPAGDGCGRILDCGDCTPPQTCGGGGRPGVCGGNNGCAPTTCAAQGIACGPTGDGCGGSIQCGTCPMGQTCGGGGVPGQCGSGPACTPIDCEAQALMCGPTGDGCGNVIQCGDCVPPQTCGGGGMLGVCGGDNGCTPRSCADQRIQCGPAGDGCGGSIDCGQCQAPLTCGGAGVPGQCGTRGSGTDGGLPNLDAGSSGCVPLTCADQNFNCGFAGDGCGGVIDCGPCADNTSCGGAGVAGRCGAGPCTPRTCADVAASCGPIGDGCGGLIDCGTCIAPAVCGGGGRANVCGVPDL